MCEVSYRPGDPDQDNHFQHLQLTVFLGRRALLTRKKETHGGDTCVRSCLYCFQFLQLVAWPTYAKHVVTSRVNVLTGRSKGKDSSKDEHEKSLDGSHGACCCWFVVGVCFGLSLIEFCEPNERFFCFHAVVLSSQPGLACE
jgi:hypothetical protein